MNYEIERKFLIKELPNLSNCEIIRYERYFLFRNQNIEIRIQKKGEKYEFERKENVNSLSTKKKKFEITKEEFDEFKKGSTQAIIRKSYKISNVPNITIKIYEWKYKGLKRVEVEFENEQNAQDFNPLSWFWNEITDSILWRDSKILDLSEYEINKMMIWN